MANQTEQTTNVDSILLEVKENLSKTTDNTIQTELAKLLALTKEIREPEYASFVSLLEIAVKSLLLDQPNVKLATDLRKKITKSIRIRKSPLNKIWQSGTPPTLVIFGLGLLLYVILAAAMILLPTLINNTDHFLGVPIELLIAVIFGGGLGSVISITVRIQDFSNMEKTDRFVLIAIGFFKPVIGTGFALFVFALIRSGMLPLAFEADTEVYFFFAIAFLTGFSERFARGIADGTERQISGVLQTSDSKEDRDKK
ncbi:MAG: hypothetical protein OXI88_11685 [Gammaproteobacteria bacterium]|nr:hypothetical protein [Gammaproteobacteria bacterium]MDE0512435.1 hypothetical protein [Gammaproteobacteria bacterium]